MRCAHLNFAVAPNEGDLDGQNDGHVHDGCRHDRALPFLRQFTKVNPPRSIGNLPLYAGRRGIAGVIEQFRHVLQLPVVVFRRKFTCIDAG